MISELDTSERVHYAMSKGLIARISMDQCAHTHGEQMVARWTHAQETLAELQAAADVLENYEGDHVWQMAEKAMDEIFELRRKLRKCREVLETNDPHNARDIFGPKR